MITRVVRDQLMTGALVCCGILIALLPVYGGKNENNPGKIGHRNVARKSFISPENERAIGNEGSERFERSANVVQDAVVDQYVTTVARRVVGHSDWKRPFAIKVVKSPHVNSSSFPGGFIYISSALLIEARNDDEIAAVIAHQVAHAAARHWAEEMAKTIQLQFLTNLVNSTFANAAAVSRVLFERR